MPPETNTPNSDSDTTREQEKPPQIQASNETDPEKVATDSKERAEQRSGAEIELQLRNHLDDNFRTLRKDLEDRLDKRLKDHKQDLENTVNRFGRLALGILSVAVILFGGGGLYGLYQAYQRGMAHVEKSVSERLDQEFKTERITTLIDEKAKEYTEKEAKKHIAGKMEEMVVPFQTNMNHALQRADAEVESLEGLFNIYLLADDAQLGSRKAYMRLQALAVETTDQGKVARKKITQIEKALSHYRHTPFMQLENLRLTTEKGDVIPFDQLPLDVIVREMESPIFRDDRRHICMIYIKFRPKEQVFRKALEVFENSDSLPTCAAFCGVLSEISISKAPFLDFKGWIEICRQEIQSE